jgi:glycosyltransferase involved in cell wall biosynthesis
VSGDSTSQPAVSVVVATYNMAQYVALAVRAILAQTYTDLEVVVIDDGSTDKTAEVMEVFRGEPRVRYLPQPNRGQPRAKNAGIEAARGRYIAFCDADDMWVPEKLARQLPYFEASERVGVVYSLSETIDPEGTRTGEISGDAPGSNVLATLFVKNIVPFGTAVVRRDVLDAVGAFDNSLPMGIDWGLWLRIATRWEFAFVREPLYLYRVWPGQMSKNWRRRYEHCFRIMEKFLRNYPSSLAPEVVRRAYADSYLGRGLCASLIEGQHGAAVSDYVRAICADPGYWPAWRELLKVPLSRRLYVK